MIGKTMNTSEYRELARKAESELNWRMAIVYLRRALDAYPHISGKLAEADRDRIITAINADKQTLRSYCPVCGGDMHEMLCPDDVMRPWCEHCRKTYTPMGYDCEDDYAKKWWCISWINGENGFAVEVS